MKGKEINYVLLSKMLLPIFLLLCMLVYQLGIRNTISEYRRYIDMNTNDLNNSTLSISPAYSATRSAAVKNLYKRFLVDTTTWRDELWNQCAVISRKFNCSVQGYSEPRVINQFEKRITVQEVTFNGRFPDLWKLQQTLGRQQGLGLVGGLTYQREPRSSTTTLKLQLFAMSNREDK
jgi:hypothetical protein